MAISRPSLTLALLQARESAMQFFRPSLNKHGLTEQQWRIIRTLREHGEMESYQLAEMVCILKSSMTGVLARLERDGLIGRRRPEHDQRRVYVRLTPSGQDVFDRMKIDSEYNYRRLQGQFDEKKMAQLFELLNELKNIKA